MPTVLRHGAFRFHFYTNEGNEPTHIHVTGKGGEMKVWLPTLSIEFSFGLSPSDQRAIMKVIRENVGLLMEEWDEFASKKI